MKLSNFKPKLAPEPLGKVLITLFETIAGYQKDRNNLDSRYDIDSNGWFQNK